MPRHPYDRFMDSSVGGYIGRFVYGTGREPPPSHFWKSTIRTSQLIANMGDRYLRATPLNRGIKRRIVEGRRTKSMSAASTVLNAKYRTRGAYRHRKVRGVPKELRAQYRLKRFLPVHITHEETTEARALAGTQAVIEFQAERLLPAVDSNSVNTGGLNNSVNRKGDNTMGTYNGGIEYNTIYRYLSGTSDARVAQSMNHRTDWTMFTNASWRDGLSAMNGLYTTAALAQAGYITPYMLGTSNYWRRAAADDASSSTDTVDPIYPFQATDYYHLTESINVTVTNNGLVPTKVTFYECILAHDVRMGTSLGLAVDGSTLTRPWGALPCPIELWRAGRAISGGEKSGIKIVDGRAGMAANSVGTTVQGDDGEGATGTRMGAPESAAAGGFNPTSTDVADIDHPNVLPGGPFLNHWYRVVPTTRTIGPGMTTTFNAHVKFNKRIPGVWWENLAGVKGLSRTFFMVARPYEMVGSTGVDEVGVSGPGSRLMVMGKTDLTLKWRKHKSFTRTDRPLNRRIYYRAAIPEIDTVQVRDPEDDDAEFEAGATAMGGDN